MTDRDPAGSGHSEPASSPGRRPATGSGAGRPGSEGPGRKIVVIGGSAGAHGALQAVCRALPAGFPAPILVAVHRSASLPGHLADILTRAGPLLAAETSDRQQLLPGRIYVAPPDHHLLVGADGSAGLSQRPPECGFRPSIDFLFRSAATAFGAATIAVLLSGTLADGVAGANAIRREGGRVIVQDPQDARFGGLPQAALDAHATDVVLRAADIPAELRRLASA